MRNPYALPLRLRRQRLDEIRQQLSALNAEQTSLSGRATALAEQAAREAALRLTTDDPGEAWFDWQRRSLDQLLRQLAALGARIEAHRADLCDELGQIGALEEAERRLQASERRRLDRREQAVADDRAATLHRTSRAA